MTQVKNSLSHSISSWLTAACLIAVTWTGAVAQEPTKKFIMREAPKPVAAIQFDDGTGRSRLHFARYYLGNRWVFMALGSLVLVVGAPLNWSWLVAAGIAPILLTLLPCAIMCAAGLCSMKMMVGSNEPKLTQGQNATETNAALGVTKVDRPAAGGSSCCHEEAAETQSPQVRQLQPNEERKESHA